MTFGDQTRLGSATMSAKVTSENAEHEATQEPVVFFAAFDDRAAGRQSSIGGSAPHFVRRIDLLVHRSSCRSLLKCR